MTNFEKKQLETPKRVCSRLKECRESRNISLQEISQRTHISKKYLEALESCRFNDISLGAIYQKNFIKRYALALGLKPDEFLNQYLREELANPDTSAKSEDTRKKKYLSNLPLLLRHIIMSVLVISAIIYLGIQVKQSIQPPKLTLYSPVNGSVVATAEISVHGATEREVQVFINNEPIITNNNGEFRERISLSAGINTIVVSAKKKHGKTTTETRHIILKSNNQLSVKK